MAEKSDVMDQVIGGGTLWLARAAGVAMFGLLAITLGAVVMRYVFNAPILGAQDLSEVSLALVIFLGLAHCGWRGGHVAVDLIAMLVPERYLRWTDFSVRLAGAALFAVMAWITWGQARDAREYGEATNLIEIPHFPFMTVAVACFALYAVVLAALAWRSFKNLPDPESP